jgi:hypothetical protein
MSIEFQVADRLMSSVMQIPVVPQERAYRSLTLSVSERITHNLWRNWNIVVGFVTKQVWNLFCFSLLKIYENKSQVAKYYVCE